ncbi:MAG TPA: carbon monoxide dehydrogenase subunit G [Burkholderiales bacterium]|nr:carbon monoxide dehydrogenase subunit G [Burkholderiales bacterium]
MEMTGEQLVPASQQDTWTALNDPQVLKACVPGCESITPTGENEYQVLMVAKVGPVSAKFKGKLTLSDVRPPDSYSISFEGQGGPAGFAKGGAQVRLAAEGGKTRLAYAVKANVGGKLAQIGSRLVDAAAKKVADDFFRNFNEKFSAVHAPAEKPADGEEHHVEPVPSDPDLPKASRSTLAFFAAGALVVYLVSLIVLID